MTPAHTQSQAMQLALPLHPGTQEAALTQLKTIFTNMGGEIHIDAPQFGTVGARFPGEHSITAAALKDTQGATGISLTCTGASLAQAQERCTTVQRQYKP
jgi:hypothetical protein